MSIDERIADRISVLCSARSSNAHEYDLCVRAVRAALADPVLRGWRPIESAPRKDCWIHVWHPASPDEVPQARIIYSALCYADGEPWETDLPTHWMPLPEPPEGKLWN
jgi:hypothetical protein